MDTDWQMTPGPAADPIARRLNARWRAEVGRRLARARLDAGMDQDQVASRLGHPRTAAHVLAWEEALIWPSTEELVAVSRVLRLSLDYLLADPEKTRAA